MRDTLVFRATAAVVARVLRDMPCTDPIVQITKNEERVAELKKALKRFVLPTRFKVADDWFDLTYPEETFPREQLSELLDRVTVYDVTLDSYVQHVAKTIISILETEEKIYMNYYEDRWDIKSTQFLTFKVFEALGRMKSVDLERIELHIPETPISGQLVVVVDDMSYSGKQLYEENEHLTRVTFLLVGCTKQAYDRLTVEENWKNWKVSHFLPEFIPVAEIPNPVRKYVDLINTEDSSAGALGFVPWKIPDYLSTFDMFWKGYVYIGHAINGYDLEPDEADLLWIPIDWSPGDEGEFDGNADEQKESIFKNSHRAPFYKHPVNALPCKQAQTTARSKRLEKIVDELNAPLYIDPHRDGWPSTMLTKRRRALSN